MRCFDKYKRQLIVIEIDEKIFLTDFDEFCQVLLPLYNKRRLEKGLDKLTDDETTNLFLELRAQNGIT